MTDLAQHGTTATLVEAIGILMVAALLLPMTRAVPGQFLRYWSYGWAALAAALFLLFAAAHAAPDYRPSLLVGYCLGEYLFGFLVWAGCREFATGAGFRSWHAALFLPLVAAGVALPLIAGDHETLFPVHAALFGGLFLFAVAATFRRGRRADPTGGLTAMRVALAGLGGVFLYSAVGGGAAGRWLPAPPAQMPEYLKLTTVTFGTLLAFGMVVMASDRMRAELEGKNGQLAAAAAELAAAARTDALTGLLNRRAFDDLTRSTSGDPFAGGLAVLDLDDLKPLNDRLGHAAGDVALQLVGRALRNSTRVTDLVYRTGGDEFVVLMPGCGLADLTDRMARLARLLTGLRLPGAAGPVDLRVAWGAAEFACRADCRRSTRSSPCPSTRRCAGGAGRARRWWARRSRCW